jgi:hypothetical protein
MKAWSTNKFTKSLRSWCRFYGFGFNPKEYQNSQKRISKKVEGTTKDMVYIQTKTERKPNEEGVEPMPF